MSVPTEQFGPYRVFEQLGIGGMASVHRAEMAGAQGYTHQIALKRMLPHVAANDDMIQAFVREARLASHLRHANVAQTYELGLVGDVYFIAMELVVGKNLRELLKYIAQTKAGPMPVPVALNILNQICEALDYAHNLTDDVGVPLGIIHRDVTPSNIIVDTTGVVKLIDFGIAKASAAGMQTMSGTLKGKFGYMAPEYIAGSLDARADLFALGVIAHELLTNRPLFTGADDLETLTRVQKMEIQPPSKRNPNVPREIDDIVMTGLARDPERRWQHATALRTALGTLTRRLGLVATNAQVVEWLAHLYDKTKPAVEFFGVEPGDSTGDLSMVVSHGDDPSMVVEVGGNTSHLPAGQQYPLIAGGTPASMLAQASRPPANNPQTLPMGQLLQPDGPRPTLVGHQSGSQPVVSAPREIPAGGAEYQAAVARYDRHSGISPSQGMNISDVLPALRQSNPQIPLPQQSNAAIQLPPMQGVRPSDRQPAPQGPRSGSQSAQQQAQQGPRSGSQSAQVPTVGMQAHSGQIKLPPAARTMMDPNQMSPFAVSAPAPLAEPPPAAAAMKTVAVVVDPPSAPLMKTVALSVGPADPMKTVALSSAAAAGLITPTPPAKRATWVFPVVMVLVVAAVAGAVVYFVLPRLTS